MKITFTFNIAGNLGNQTVAQQPDNPPFDRKQFDGREYTDIFAQVNTVAVGTGGAISIQVFLQSSVDGGTTWRDFGNTAAITAAGVTFAQISAKTSGGAAFLAASDGALTTNTTVQGPFGDLFRVKVVITGAPTGGNTNIVVSMTLKY